MRSHPNQWESQRHDAETKRSVWMKVPKGRYRSEIYSFTEYLTLKKGPKLFPIIVSTMSRSDIHLVGRNHSNSVASVLGCFFRGHVDIESPSLPA